MYIQYGHEGSFNISLFLVLSRVGFLFTARLRKNQQRDSLVCKRVSISDLEGSSALRTPNLSRAFRHCSNLSRNHRERERTVWIIWCLTESLWTLGESKLILKQTESFHRCLVSLTFTSGEPLKKIGGWSTFLILYEKRTLLAIFHIFWPIG